MSFCPWCRHRESVSTGQFGGGGIQCGHDVVWYGDCAARPLDWSLALVKRKTKKSPVETGD